MLKAQKQELIGVERDEGDDQVVTVKETGEDRDTNPGDDDGLSADESGLISETSGSDDRIKSQRIRRNDAHADNNRKTSVAV